MTWTPKVTSRDRYNRKVKVQVHTANLFDLTFNLFPVTFQNFYFLDSDFRIQLNQFQPFYLYQSSLFIAHKNTHKICSNGWYRSHLTCFFSVSSILNL